MSLFLVLLSGILWTLVYIDAIRISFKDKTYAIPLWALALNIAWEFLQTIFGFREVGLAPQICINAAWTLFDIFIVVAFFKYGMRHFPRHLKKFHFIIWSLMAFTFSFIIEYMFIVEFDLINGGSYAAFIQNLIMSLLFINMLVQRNSSLGQTKLIAYAKWIGTLAPTILFGLMGGMRPFDGNPNSFVLVLGIMCSIVDIIYILMLTKKQKEEKALRGS